MAKYQLLLPKMGESVAEATIIKWLKNPGDYIEADDAVMEIATDKVDSEVPSPVAGRLVEKLCKEDDVVQVGAVIAIIETDEPEKSAPAPQAAAASAPQPVAVPQPTPVAAPAPQPVSVPQQTYQQPAPQPVPSIPGIDQLAQSNGASGQPAAEVKNESRFYSPLVKHIALQE
ncbi:MAG: 2-oxo acid dehydrogenase subunit E2, partial [Mucilaginibacter sp.]|nr:2-oxo acid dehydrogenase subunit E2 [Mucilaginibacter sp.]